MAASASASPSATVAGGDSGLRLAATAAAGRHRVRLLHSFSSGRVPRRPQVACCVRSAPDARRSAPAPLRSRNVHSANNYAAASEERIGKLIQKFENEGINPKQWKIGNFHHVVSTVQHGTVFGSKCGFKGVFQADVVSNISQGKIGIECEADQEVEAKKTTNKREVSEEDLNLEPLCDEVSKSTFNLMETLDAKVVGPIMQKLYAVAGQVDDLRKKVDAIAEKLDVVAGQVNDLSKEVDAKAEKLDVVVGQVDDLSKKVDAMAEKFNAPIA